MRGYIFTYFITKKTISDETYLHASERKLQGIVEIYQSKPIGKLALVQIIVQENMICTPRFKHGVSN